MITDTEVKIKGVRALTESLGKVEAERFIALIQREPFDYTKWHPADNSTGRTRRSIAGYRIVDSLHEGLIRHDKAHRGRSLTCPRHLV